jgi:hypothetical protein
MAICLNDRKEASFMGEVLMAMLTGGLVVFVAIVSLVAVTQEGRKR